jgi:PP-loop superfamily ATP-utilizing enzyme
MHDMMRKFKLSSFDILRVITEYKLKFKSLPKSNKRRGRKPKIEGKAMDRLKKIVESKLSEKLTLQKMRNMILNDNSTVEEISLSTISSYLNNNLGI